MYAIRSYYDDPFYHQWIHDSRHALGAFCSGGTIANLTALWVARNRLCAPQGDFKGIAQEGLARSLRHLGCDGLAVLVSRRGHYSLGKAADLLGIGRDQLVLVDTDDNERRQQQTANDGQGPPATESDRNRIHAIR